MSCASNNTRCQCCIIISPIQIPFLIKTNANVVDFQGSLSLSFSLNYQPLIRGKNDREQSLLCLLQIFRHYTVLHLSSNLMQLLLSTVCGNLCNIKSISGFYSTALPHYHSSFWMGERDRQFVYAKQKNPFMVFFKIIYNTINSLWALNVKSTVFQRYVTEQEAHQFFWLVLSIYLMCLCIIYMCGPENPKCVMNCIQIDKLCCILSAVCTPSF